MDATIIPEFNSWLEELVRSNGSDLHVKVGSPPMVRLPHGLQRFDRDPLSPLETQAIADGVVPEDRKALLREKGEVDFAYSVPNVGRFRANVFRQRGSISHGAAEAPVRRPKLRGARSARRRSPHQRRAARPHPRDRPDRFGQDHHARRDDRLPQPHQAGAHRDGRGPDRGAAPRRRRLDQPARSRPGHRRLPVGASRGAAAGPRRHPDRRDARHRDGARGDAGGRDRPPRALDAAHAGRDRDREPRH